MKKILSTTALGLCVISPLAFSQFNPSLEWSWTETDITTFDNAGDANGQRFRGPALNILTTPNVVDVNNDGTPDVVFLGTNWTHGLGNYGGRLIALDGKTGEEIFASSDGSVWDLPDAGCNMASGDIDNDGHIEFITCGFTWNKQNNKYGKMPLMAFEHDGTLKWRGFFDEWYLGTLSIVDINKDGNPEIVAGKQVFNNQGNLIWNGGADSEGLSIAADIDNDGNMDVLGGTVVYDNNGAIKWQIEMENNGSAIANLDEDEFGEIIRISNKFKDLYILEHTGEVKWGPVALPEQAWLPLVADADGDGEPEIALSGRTSFMLFEADGTLKWSSPIHDPSTVSTASSFDLDGDGSHEFIYRDEKYLRIFDGKNGTELFRANATSCTAGENPVVADVDADGHVEIVVGANNNCSHDGFGGEMQGVYVFGDDANWVRGRGIWNQHSYQITNINDDGSIPQNQKSNWQVPGLNNFRANIFMPCDIDSDWEIEISDIFEIRKAFGQTPTPADKRDANNDGKINTADWRFCRNLRTGQ